MNREKKRETLDVVPMAVGLQNINGLLRIGDLLTQIPDARSGIQHHVLAILQFNVDAGSVSAKFCRVGPWRWDGPSYTVKRQSQLRPPILRTSLWAEQVIGNRAWDFPNSLLPIRRE